jgi:CBS domain-containing protein
MICPRCGRDNVPGDEQCAYCQLDLAPLDQPAPQDRVQSDLMERTVGDLKPRAPVILTRSATVAEAVAAMVRDEVGTVLVVDNEGRLCGIFTERDLLQRVPDADARSGQRPIGDFMTPDPETVAPDDSLALALQRMDVGGYRHLPVSVDGTPIGVLSVRDMVRHIAGLCRDGDGH